MTIPFKNIPTNLRTPLFYAELDASHANTAALPQRALLIGQKTAAGTLPANVPSVSQSQSDGRAAAGPGSTLAGMIDAYRANDPTGEMWLLPLADDPAATAATGAVTFTGTTTAAGTLALYVGGRLVSIPLASGQTAAQVAMIVAGSIAATQGLPVSAVAAAGVVTLSALNKGLVGNDVDVRTNYQGSSAGEVTPAGLGVAITPMANGAVNPSLTAALTALNDTAFDFIVCSLTDATSVAAIAALLSDTSGRWAWSSQIYGHCFMAVRGTAGSLAALGTSTNNQHISIVGYADSPSPPWKWAAAFAGAAAVSLRADPGVPLQYLTVAGILAPPIASRFSQLIRNNTLLYGGVSTWTADYSGQVVIENMITTYVANAAGQPDDSYLEIETLFLLVYVLRRLSSLVSQKYGRMKLTADGTRLSPGSNVVTPSTIRADLIAAYREMEASAMVQQSDAFSAGLVVEKDATNPNRVNVLLPAVLIDQLRVFAVLMQFRLA